MRSLAEQYWLEFFEFWSRLRLTRHIGFWKNFKGGFTLAEVLTTLGIIGVVAAITMPTLITNYQKKVTASRLAQSYSIIGQALKSAEVDYGDMPLWGIGIDETNSQTSQFPREEFLTRLVQTYILPYLKNAKDYGYINALLKYNYKASSWTSYYFSLPNGALVETTLAFGCPDNNYDAQGICNVEKTYITILFKIDVNGFKGPNTLGRDIFISSINNYKYQMYINGITTRNVAVSACKSSKLECGYLIQMDGWQIKDDYPW